MGSIRVVHELESRLTRVRLIIAAYQRPLLGFMTVAVNDYLGSRADFYARIYSDKRQVLRDPGRILASVIKGQVPVRRVTNKWSVKRPNLVNVYKIPRVINSPQRTRWRGAQAESD